jgi:molybdopterin converting factor small subunit
VKVRVRLGSRLSGPHRPAVLHVALRDGATVADLYEQLAATEPELSGALRSALPVVAGEHAPRDRVLEPGQEVALLLPISGG